MIGYYGDIIFETSDKRILTFAGFTRNATGRWMKHDSILRKPDNEFLGPDLDVITFTINLNANFGVNPREQMDKWLIKCRDGTAETLVVGDQGLGMDKWVVKDVSQIWNTITNQGQLISGNVEIELEEYIRNM